MLSYVVPTLEVMPWIYLLIREKHIDGALLISLLGIPSG